MHCVLQRAMNRTTTNGFTYKLRDVCSSAIDRALQRAMNRTTTNGFTYKLRAVCSSAIHCALQRAMNRTTTNGFTYKLRAVCSSAIDRALQRAMNRTTTNGFTYNSEMDRTQLTTDDRILLKLFPLLIVKPFDKMMRNEILRVLSTQLIYTSEVTHNVYAALVTESFKPNTRQHH